MRTKFLYCFFALFVVNALFIGCKRELTTKPNNLVEDEDVFTDKNLITSTLAGFYGDIHQGGGTTLGWGQNNNSWNSFQQDPDDGVNNNGGPSVGNLQWGRDRYRVMDYGKIRRLNQFLAGIRSEPSRRSMTAGENANFEGQALFLRAYIYFMMTRSLGGMTIVGDQVFEYAAGQDITPYRLPRNSEADCYKYVIDECDKAAKKFTEGGAQNPALGIAKTTNSAVANKWTALMLKARAAVYAASIAKYTPLRAPGNVKKDAKGTDVVGIPTAMANEFYTTALAAAQEVISQSPYVLQVSATNPELAFYQATTIKASNSEVIWATDRKAPQAGAGNLAIRFTADVAPVSKGHNDGQNEGNSLGPTLNLVEAFENKDGSDPKIKDFDVNGNHIIYDDAEVPFKAKDARLWGTVIWPSAIFRTTPVPIRAGELRSLAKPYTYTVNAPDRTRDDLPTGPNGPADVSTNFVNKTGFNIRKWVDETPNSGIAPNWSEIWWPRFRISEAYMIAAEAAFELGQTGVALTNINKIRVDRGRIQPLTAGTLTFDKIVNENRVEFAFEDHRLWDLIRWRLAHIYWNGVPDDPIAQAMQLYPYRINIAGNPNNGKWVFRRARSYRRVTTPFTFLPDSYYSTISANWVNPNNPNWVGNPYQNF
jgi:hypothetical protein